MALGIVTRKLSRGKPGQGTIIDGMPVMGYPGNNYFVDGDVTGGDGKSWETAFATIGAALTQAALDVVSAGLNTERTIYIKARKMAAGATDPVSYAETIIIPATLPYTRLVGVANGLTQGGQPQVKKGSGAVALLTVRAPGCLIQGITFNGNGSTGGGILLDDDGSTKTAFGTVIRDCYFKNCVGSNALDASTGGAIQLKGAPWQIRIEHNRFYNNVGDVTVIGQAQVAFKEVEVVDNEFIGPASATDCNIYLVATTATNGIEIKNNTFHVLPALSSGVNVRFMKLTNCSGIIAHNFFGTSTLNAFAAAGSQAFVPTTMFLAGNWGEGTALITRA